jgi:hypothetical protein
MGTRVYKLSTVQKFDNPEDSGWKVLWREKSRSPKARIPRVDPSHWLLEECEP